MNLINELESIVADTQAAEVPTEIVKPAPKEPKRLNEKAMTVKLVTRKPTMSKRDLEAEQLAQSALGDNGIAATSKLFRDAANPVRVLVNNQTAIYAYHKLKSLPYEDRGRRLLGVNGYDQYRAGAKPLCAQVENTLRSYRNDPTLYDAAVQMDITYRNRPNSNGVSTNRAKVGDYPTLEQFLESFSTTFVFEPLPDNSHWLFDVDAEDRAALDQSMEEIYSNAMGELKNRLIMPLTKLVDTLHTETRVDDVTGKKYGFDLRTQQRVDDRTGTFRDTTFTNVIDAIHNARELSLGDEGVIAACDAVEMCLPPVIQNNIDLLRDSPIVRQEAAKRLAEVASKMGGFFGGN